MDPVDNIANLAYFAATGGYVYDKALPTVQSELDGKKGFRFIPDFGWLSQGYASTPVHFTPSQRNNCEH